MTRRRGSRGNLGAAAGALIVVAAGLSKLPPGPVTPAIAQSAPVVVSAPAPAPGPARAPGAPPAAPAAAPPAVETPTPTSAASADCLKRFAIDLPEVRGDGVAARETLICRRGYVLSFDADTRDPDWVMERLAPSDLQGKASRTNKFMPDPVLHGAGSSLADYTSADGSGTHYDRGHQAPAGDTKFDQQIMDQSFFLSNMAPQIGIGFNRGVWKFLEESVRAWVSCGGHTDLYVITGPIYAAHGATLGPDKVSIPASFFKIVYDPNSGRAVGFVLPNKKIGSTIPDLQVYVKPIADIETDTGLHFFRSFDQRLQDQLKLQPGTAWGHIGTCAGTAGE